MCRVDAHRAVIVAFGFVPVVFDFIAMLGDIEHGIQIYLVIQKIELVRLGQIMRVHEFRVTEEPMVDVLVQILCDVQSHIEIVIGHVQVKRRGEASVPMRYIVVFDGIPLLLLLVVCPDGRTLRDVFAVAWQIRHQVVMDGSPVLKFGNSDIFELEPILFTVTGGLRDELMELFVRFENIGQILFKRQSDERLPFIAVLGSVFDEVVPCA